MDLTVIHAAENGGEGDFGRLLPQPHADIFVCVAPQHLPATTVHAAPILTTLFILCVHRRADTLLAEYNISNIPENGVGPLGKSDQEDEDGVDPVAALWRCMMKAEPTSSFFSHSWCFIHCVSAHLNNLVTPKSSRRT